MILNLVDDPVEKLFQTLSGQLHNGAFWTRREHGRPDESYDLHFTVLHASEIVEDTKILIHDGTLAGSIMTLHEFETLQWIYRFDMVTYWPVMDDEIDRVRFSPPR